MATRLNLGSGDSQFYGFTSVDKYDPEADVRADLTALPFPDESVEEIVAFQVIEHLPYQDTEKAFQEMWRVLQPGGSMTTECPDIEYLAHEIIRTGHISDMVRWNMWGQYYRPWDEARYGEEALMLPNAIHYHGFTFNDLKTIADKLGFEIYKLPMDMKKDKYEENLAIRWHKPTEPALLYPATSPTSALLTSPETASTPSVTDDQTRLSSSTTAAPKRRKRKGKYTKRSEYWNTHGTKATPPPSTPD